MQTNNEHPLVDINQTVILNAPIQKVWEKVSTAEGIALWFMPNDFQGKVGHEFHLQSPFGPSPCKVNEYNPPHRLSFEWDTEGWIVSFILKEIGDKTEFTLIHGGWKNPDDLLTKPNEKSSLIRERMDHGWTGIVHDRLKKVVEGQVTSSAQKYDVFQAIADPTRREVLRLLTKDELPISKITTHFPMSRTAIAKHLHVLTEAKLVSGRKEGREKLYRLHPEPLKELQEWLSYYEQFWNNKLSILKHVVENDDK